MHIIDIINSKKINCFMEYYRVNKLIKEDINKGKYYKNINDFFIKNFHYSPLKNRFLDFDDLLRHCNLKIPNNNMSLFSLFVYYEIILTSMFNSRNKIIEDNSYKMKYIQVIKNINIILNMFNYKYILNKNNKIVYIVEKNKFTTEAIETTDNEQLALELLEYNRFSLKGNVEEKRKVLNLIANHIEPLQKSKIFSGTAYSSLNSDVGLYLNNFNIRHNNLEGAKRQDFLLQMSVEELEMWYDDIYSSFLMLLIAEKQLKIHSNLEELKPNIKK